MGIAVEQVRSETESGHQILKRLISFGKNAVNLPAGVDGLLRVLENHLHRAITEGWERSVVDGDPPAFRLDKARQDPGKTRLAAAAWAG